MRLLIAPTAFKGSLTPAQVAQAMNDGVDLFCKKYAANFEVDILPLADGGDGTVESIHMACGGRVHEVEVLGAIGEPRTAKWLELNDDVAIVELASACGISGLEAGDLSPLKAHTRGLGSVIRHAIDTMDSIDPMKELQIVISLGGSASTDGGSAALSELGAGFLDAHNLPVIPEGGADLVRIHSCDLRGLKRSTRPCKITIATDVENVLLGEHGAAHIFAPQKGADFEQIQFLDQALAFFADVMESALFEKSNKEPEISRRNMPGCGAAGGTAFGLACGYDAEIVSGFAFMANLVDLYARIEKADIILTGEGRIDESTLSGKVVGSLLKATQAIQKPLWAFAASVDQQFFATLADCKIELIRAVVQSGAIARSGNITRTVFKELEYVLVTERKMFQALEN